MAAATPLLDFRTSFIVRSITLKLLKWKKYCESACTAVIVGGLNTCHLYSSRNTTTVFSLSMDSSTAIIIIFLSTLYQGYSSSPHKLALLLILILFQTQQTCRLPCRSSAHQDPHQVITAATSDLLLLIPLPFHVG